MRFKSEEERANHPYAKKIPYALWANKNLFDLTLSSTEFNLMSSSLRYICDNPPLFLAHESQQKQLNAWLCILIQYSNEKADNLLLTAHHLKLSEPVIFQGAIIIGRTDIVNKLNTALPEIRKSVYDNNYLIFILATALGKKNSIDWLFINFSGKKDAMLSADNFSAYEWAGRLGSIDLLEFFKKEAPHLLKTLFKTDNGRVLASLFAYIAYDGQLEVLEWFEREFKQYRREEATSLPLFSQILTYSNHEPFYWAARNGHLAILKWLAKKNPRQLPEMIAAEDYYCTRLAATYGHLTIIQWLAKKTPRKLQELIAAHDYALFQTACSKEDEPLFNWLVQQVDKNKLPHMLICQNYSPFGLAAKNGHLSLLKKLKCLVDNDFYTMVTSNNCEAYCAAAELGRIDMLEWFEHQTPRSQWLQLNHRDAFLLALKMGHIETLNWFKARFPDDISDWLKQEDYAGLTLSVRCGRLVALNWVKQCHPKVLELALINGALIGPAASKNRLEILRWLKAELLDRGVLENILFHAQLHGAFCKAAKKGHAGVLEWIWTQINSNQLASIIISGNYIIAENAANNGHMEVLVWLMKHSDVLKKEQATRMFTTIFFTAATAGHAHILNWLKKAMPQLQSNFTQDQLNKLVHIITAHYQKEEYKICDLLLSDVNFFTHMDKFDRESHAGTCLYHFVRSKLALLREYGDHPTLVINSYRSTDTPELYYLFLRNLVKTDESSQQENIKYLLSIPSIRVFAERIDDRTGNELLNLSLASGKQLTALLIRHNTRLGKWAEDNNYFGDEDLKDNVTTLRTGVDIKKLKAKAEKLKSTDTSKEPDPTAKQRSQSARSYPNLWNNGLYRTRGSVSAKPLLESSRSNCGHQ